jgi:hypothetical protein
MEDPMSACTLRRIQNWQPKRKLDWLESEGHVFFFCWKEHCAMLVLKIAEFEHSVLCH